MDLWYQQHHSSFVMQMIYWRWFRLERTQSISIAINQNSSWMYNQSPFMWTVRYLLNKIHTSPTQLVNLPSLIVYESTYQPNSNQISLMVPSSSTIRWLKRMDRWELIWVYFRLGKRMTRLRLWVHTRLILSNYWPRLTWRIIRERYSHLRWWGLMIRVYLYYR
jgi:hypothetical protein